MVRAGGDYRNQTRRPGLRTSKNIPTVECRRPLMRGSVRRVWIVVDQWHRFILDFDFVSGRLTCGRIGGTDDRRNTLRLGHHSYRTTRCRRWTGLANHNRALLPSSHLHIHGVPTYFPSSIPRPVDRYFQGGTMSFFEDEGEPLSLARKDTYSRSMVT